MKRVSVRGCWGQTGPFLALLCLAPGSAAHRQSQWFLQWCLAQRAMLDQAVCLSLTGVHPCLPPGAGWHCQPSLFICFLIWVRKRFSLMTAPGEEEATWLMVLSLCIGLKEEEKGRKKIVFAHQFLFHRFPPWKNLRWFPSTVLSSVALTVCLQK